MIRLYRLISIMIITVVLLFFQGCPKPKDPDIFIYAEIDCKNKYLPLIHLAHDWVSEVTEEDQGNRRGLYDKYDETHLDISDEITQTELWNLCRDHDNLSRYEWWWVYVMGINKLAYSGTVPYGITKIVGSPSSPDDRSWSGISIGLIERDCSYESDAVKTVTAHEIFHQFHVWDGGNHCPNPYCIMYGKLNTSNPQTELCSDCQEELRIGQP